MERSGGNIRGMQMEGKQTLLSELHQARLDRLKEICAQHGISKNGSVEVLRARLIADLVLDEWDFSPEGRIRQSLRMKSLADFEKKHGRIVICDFVCPTRETKQNFDPDITIWMNTIESGRYEDTNKMFEEPLEADYRITEMNDENHKIISEEILKNV